MQNLDNIRSLVLGSILTANEFGNIDLSIVMNSGINIDWFESNEHRELFKVIHLYYDANKPFDDNIIMRYIRKVQIPNAEEFMLNIMAQKQVPQNILMEHISYLKENYHKKMLRKLNIDISKMLDDENITSDAISQMVQNQLDGYISLNNDSSTKTLTEIRRLRKLKPPAERTETEIPFIDTVLTDKHGKKGFRNEGLIYVSGLKESGKTFIVTKIIENISKKHHVMFGSLEFGADLYDENVEEQQEEFTFNGNTDNIHVFDEIYEINAMCAEIRLQHKLFGIVLAVVDSAMRTVNNNPLLKTDERRISEKFVKLGMLSKELRIPIAIIVQSSKEDLKSSMVSVKGSMDADHEGYVWFHLTKVKTKSNIESELRHVMWVKNKDTKKHPVQHLMFVPETSDFYRVELDENGYAGKALDKFRRPPPKVIETVYEDIPTEKSKSKLSEAEMAEMPTL